MFRFTKPQQPYSKMHILYVKFAICVCVGVGSIKLSQSLSTSAMFRKLFCCEAVIEICEW